MVARVSRWTRERQDRLALASIFLIGAMALVGGILLAEDRLDRAVRDHALGEAERVTAAAADVLQPFSDREEDETRSEIEEEAMRLLRRTSGVERMLVVGGDFIVRFDSEGSLHGSVQDSEDIASILADGKPLLMLHESGPPISLLSDLSAAKFLAEIYVPVREEEKIVGAFELYIDVTQHVTETILIAREGYVVFAGAVLLAMAGIVIFVWRSLARRRRDVNLIDLLRERAERAAERLQLALTQQERFSAYVAHELRTPLAIMLAQIDAMSRSKEADGLRSDVERMMHLVDRLLEFARTESMAVAPDASADLGKLARELVAKLFPAFRKVGHDLVLEAPEGAVPVAADPALVESALRNLIENAGRHTPPSGTVTVTVALNPTRMEVADHGPGLDPAHLPELMKPFRRGSRGGAAGLGLAIVAEAARRMGAKINCRATDQAGGATFSLTFSEGEPLA